MGGGYIYYKIENFRVVLSLESDGYSFKEIKREVLWLGKSGFGVKELQRVFGLVENGYFDNTLELEIKNFQKSNGLKVDGIVGKMTYQALGIKD
jgi:murein L,D-transpeptidase YcbB/YkuD